MKASLIGGAAIAAVLAFAPLSHAQTVKPALREERTGNFTNIIVQGPGSWGDLQSQLAKLAADGSRATGVPPPGAAERDELPAPLLLERGLRALASDRDQGHYLIALAKLRMRWDTAQCRDQSAGEAPVAVHMWFVQAKLTPTPAPGDADRANKVVQQIIREGSVFTGKASPWWACSHGLDAAMAATKGDTLKEEEWRVPLAEREQRRRLFEASLRQTAAQMQAQTAARP